MTCGLNGVKTAGVFAVIPDLPDSDSAACGVGSPAQKAPISAGPGPSVRVKARPRQPIDSVAWGTRAE